MAQLDSDPTLRAVLNTDALPPPESLIGDPERLGDGSNAPGDGAVSHAAPSAQRRLGYLSDEGAELYSERVHELETQHPHGFLEHEKLKHGRAPEIKVWTPHGSADASTAGTRSPVVYENSHQQLISEHDLRQSMTGTAPPSVPSPAPRTPMPAAPPPPMPASVMQQQQQQLQDEQAAAVVQGQAASREDMLRAQREVDVRTAFAGLPKIRPHWVHQYMQIMLVGEDGLGRTTFTRNLFAAYASDPNFPVNDASVPNAKKIFKESPERLRTEIMLQDPDNKIWYHYLVQDTPGYGDSDDLALDRRLILDYIDSSSERYLQAEQAPNRKSAMHSAKDTRVDVCLYFLPPHRLRQMDLDFMAELSQKVPVVPILSKADTMTVAELREFRHRVRTALHRSHAMWQFSRDALEEAGARHGPPFSVIASNTMDLATGRFWPVRKYPWGSCEALLSTHSDLTVLRRLLFESGYNEIKEQTERRYHAFRADHTSTGPVKAAASHLLRSLATVGGLVVAVWLVVNGAPVLKDEVRRKETVRRVKEKVGEVVEDVVDTVDTVSGVAKSTTAAAAETTKKGFFRARDEAKKAAQMLETEETRRLREEEEARARKRGFLGWLRG